MNDAELDRKPSPVTPIPSPTAGAGSSELKTASDDPLVLRALLQRARERLAFYESYDRIIGENIRRTGELMLESIDVREAAQVQTEQAERLRVQLKSESAANRRSHHELLQSVANELDVLRSGLDQVRTRLTAALSELSEEAPPAPAFGSQADTPITPEPSLPETPAAETSTEAMEAGGAPVPVEPDTSPETTLSIDVIVQGIANATTALSLQRYLGNLDSVIGVEAREFADGVLRLHVTASGPIGGKTLAGWSDGRGLRVVQEQTRLLELDLTPVT